MKKLSLLLLLCAAPVCADEPKAQPVPYRLTDTHHVLVRAKLNGKGPFNFIVDTGCPVLLLAEPVGKKLGLSADKHGRATLDRLELEGGLTQTKVPIIVKTPFQIEGINSLNLAGAELHGMMGYTVLAKYRTQFDFTRTTMDWTPLDYEPPAPQALSGKVDTGSIDMLASLVRILSFLAGVKTQAPQPRGFFGFELTDAPKEVQVAKVLADSPAARGGLHAGDRILEVQGKAVRQAADVLAGASKLTVGRELRLGIERAGAKQELKLTAGSGF